MKYIPIVTPIHRCKYIIYIYITKLPWGWNFLHENKTKNTQNQLLEPKLRPSWGTKKSPGKNGHKKNHKNPPDFSSDSGDGGHDYLEVEICVGKPQLGVFFVFVKRSPGGCNSSKKNNRSWEYGAVFVVVVVAVVVLSEAKQKT